MGAGDFIQGTSKRDPRRNSVIIDQDVIYISNTICFGFLVSCQAMAACSDPLDFVCHAQAGEWIHCATYIFALLGISVLVQFLWSSCER